MNKPDYRCNRCGCQPCECDQSLLPDSTIPDDLTELHKKLADWVTDYKDAAERHALAESPKESADYLITLVSPLIAKLENEIHVQKFGREGEVIARKVCLEEIAKLEAENKELRETNAHLNKLVGIIVKGREESNDRK